MKAFRDEVVDQLIGDEVAGIHEGPGPKPEWGAGVPGGAEQVAGRDVNHLAAAAKQLGLSALTASWRAKKDQTHERPRFSLALNPR